MTEAMLSPRPRNEDEAKAAIQRLVVEYGEGRDEAEPEAIEIARKWRFDLRAIRAQFRDVQEVRQEEQAKAAATVARPKVEAAESVEEGHKGPWDGDAAELLAELGLDSKPAMEAPVLVTTRSPFSLVSLAPEQNVVALREAKPAKIPYEIERMNERHAIISNYGGKCMVMEVVPSLVDPNETELVFQTDAAFRGRYANRHVDLGGSRPMKLSKYWLEHWARRQYDRLDLVPGGPRELPEKVLNLWQGWGVEAEEGDWNLLRRHVDEVLAAGNPEFADYIIRWTAWNVQNPGKPAEVALVLRGGKGSGKGVFGRVLTRIFRGHSLHLSNPVHLTGQYNAHLQNKLVLWLDEGMWAGDKKAESVLKALITEEQIFIEPKGVDAFQWKNRLKLYISGNAEWVVPMTHDERRYAINTVSDHVAQRPEYFEPLFAEMDNGGVAAMLWELLGMDLGDWHPRDNIPQTEAMVEQKVASLSGLEQWFLEKLNNGELPGPEAGNPRMVAAARLIADVKAAHNARCKYVTAAELGRFLRKAGCEHKSNGRQWCWIFPPLAEARAAWAAKFHGEWEWDAVGVSDWNAKPNQLAVDFGLGQ
jgi:hypothetical protein